MHEAPPQYCRECLPLRGGASVSITYDHPSQRGVNRSAVSHMTLNGRVCNPEEPNSHVHTLKYVLPAAFISYRELTWLHLSSVHERGRTCGPPHPFLPIIQYQKVATAHNCNLLQSAAIYCNYMQLTAIDCNYMKSSAHCSIVRHVHLPQGPSVDVEDGSHGEVHCGCDLLPVHEAEVAHLKNGAALHAFNGPD